MHAFFVRWRSARQFGEFEIFADEGVGACIVQALETSGGYDLWKTGTLWKCPGCEDRTVRTEEFLEGLRRAFSSLQNRMARCEIEGLPAEPIHRAALDWMANVETKLLGCERDRVYIKDEGTQCTFARETFISRI